MPVRSVSWLASFGIATVAAVAALLAGGVVASWCVDWYRVSSFEGNSGFFVVFMALLSGAGGAIVGLTVARACASSTGMNAFTALGLSVAIVLAVAGGVAASARLFADVPPEIDGERLFLLVELRWPAGQRPPSPGAGAGIIRLGSLSGWTLRVEEPGPLFLEDARLDGDYWIVPGVVPIFTSRGTPVINAFVGNTQVTSFLPPLRRFRRKNDLQWSEWRPAAVEGQPLIGIPVSYRYRVSRRSMPVRRQAIGPLTIDTVLSEVFSTSDTDALSARSTFRIGFDDRIVPGIETATELAVLSTDPLALLARSHYSCYLVTMTTTGPTVTQAPPCRDESPTWRLDDGPVRIAGDVTRPQGWLDRETFREPGLYLLGPALLDTRALTISAQGWPSEPIHQVDLPPMGLSPDQRTMAWFSPGDGYEEPPTVATRRLDTGETSTLAIDRTRMRYRSAALDMTPAWLDHHFAWMRDADGVDRLEVRASFTPLPHRGALSESKPGDYQSYVIAPGSAALQAAVVDILLKELGATRIDDEYATVNTPRVDLGGMPISVQYVEGGSLVSVHSYKSQPETMARIAAHVDRILASGRLDALMLEEQTQD